MARIRLTMPFAGELPALNEFYLPDKNAVTARNVKLWSGSLKPLRSLSAVRDTDISDPATIFKYTDAKWLQFSAWHDVVLSPSFNDTYDRAYYLGPSAVGLRVTDSTLVGASPPYPGSSYLTGVPAPTSAPTMSKSGTGSGTAETRFYVYTAVNGWGEEGPPSPVSAALSVQAGETVSVTLSSVGAGSYKPITKYRVYRSNNAGSSYQYVGETATTSFSDSTFALPFGQEELPSAEWDPPPTDIAGVVVSPHGFLAGFRENELLFSEAGLSHAWPVRYRITLEHKVVRVCLVDNGLAVLTDGRPYLVVGSHPGSVVAARLPVPYKCVSARGAAQIGSIVVYPTPRGLAAIDASGARMVSDAVWDDDDWREIGASTFTAFQWKGLYICFHTKVDGSKAGFLFNPAQPAAGIVTFEGISVTSGFEDPATGALYLTVNNRIQEWDAGSNLTMVYKGPPREQAVPVKMPVLQVIATEYPVIVAVYRDGELQDRVEVGENRPRRIHGAQLGRTYQLEIISSNEVRDVVLASSMGELGRI